MDLDRNKIMRPNNPQNRRKSQEAKAISDLSLARAEIAELKAEIEKMTVTLAAAVKRNNTLTEVLMKYERESEDG